jgi:hypothetical protein
MPSPTDVRYECLLRINNQFKGIPYGGGDHDDGSTNHGFKVLKGATEPAALVPEATGDRALSNALEALNEASTAFFSVGCEKSLNADGDQYWKCGYIEFALNDTVYCADPRNYFALFHAFSTGLPEVHFHLPIRFMWELEGAYFVDANVSGWTATVWITTSTGPTEQDVEDAWSDGLQRCIQSLLLQPVHVHSPIYPLGFTAG